MTQSSGSLGRLGSVLALGTVAVLGAACSGSGSGSTTGGVAPPTNLRLVAFEYGRLVDVYGLDNGRLELYRRDVMVGSDIDDERQAGDPLRDEEITYDFINSDPDTLQPRLFITREISSKQFQDAFEKLDDSLRLISPGRFGQNTKTTPFSVVPRNGALRLSFNGEVGVGDDFFYERDQNGRIVGLKNTEAVQILEIKSDPSKGAVGTFEVLDTRIIARGSEIVIDPVLLGSEGLQLNARNNASGMPASPDQVGANIRLALALEGPLAIPGLKADSVGGGTTGINNSGRRSVIRDFRSGNSDDNSSEISRGFIRDPIPPKVIGEITTYLEKVENVDANSQRVTIFKNGIKHELDRGDVLRMLIDNSGVPVATTDILEDPVGDRGSPGVQHVTALVRRTPGLLNLSPNIPPGLSGSAREAWLVANAPRAIVVAEFTKSKIDPISGKRSEDEATNFIRFAPSPRPDAQGNIGPPNQNVSPFAGAVIRFTKPVDLSTVKPLDTMFFATRDLLDEQEKQAFISARGMEPASFREEKYRTPHLIASRRFDEDGSQTAIRLQPPFGFYLDEEMRTASTPHEYYLHIISGSGGIRDLSGNPVDFQSDVGGSADELVIPFTVDTRKTASGQPFFDDNLVVSVCRRFAGRDEDEQPSYYWQEEIQTTSGGTNPLSFNLDDIFGGIFYLGDGSIQARPAGRVSKIVDNLNQQPVAAQGSIFQWCPFEVDGERLVAANTANTLFGQGIQNPLNPYGARLQTVWREIDLSLSRVRPDDFNLDVEQMNWAPFTGQEIVFDEFDQASLYLGHSENRPEPCVGQFSALPELSNSGLRRRFQENYVFNPDASDPSGTLVESQPAPHPAYVNTPMTIDVADAITEPNGINRYLPLPEFEEPYFVYRDETVLEQGANVREGSDISGSRDTMDSYILSPFLGGKGRQVQDNNGVPEFQDGFWHSQDNYELKDSGNVSKELRTGGLVGTIALPLLADFQTLCDSPTLPAGNGYIALGVNGWQIALTVTSSPNPHFRAYSGGVGAVGGSAPECVEPGSSQWSTASGGKNPNTGQVTRPRDNSLYWIWCDFLKRQTVVTAGFVDLYNPHRLDLNDPTMLEDPRLGPYVADSSGNPLGTHIPRFNQTFEPLRSDLPIGTSITSEFRAAGAVDVQPWRWSEDDQSYDKPDTQNFPLDPFKAGDAHIRKFDQRSTGSGGVTRDWWTHFYNRTVTHYTDDPDELMDQAFLRDFQGPNETFSATDVRYVNWRFIIVNNVDAQPTISPKLESFTLNYRFEEAQ